MYTVINKSNNDKSNLKLYLNFVISENEPCKFSGIIVKVIEQVYHSSSTCLKKEKYPVSMDIASHQHSLQVSVYF